MDIKKSAGPGMANDLKPSIVDQLDDQRVKQHTMRLEIGNGEYLVYDFSKSHASERDENLIVERLERVGLEQRMDEMWSGFPVNITENRPVLHYLLREQGILDTLKAHLSQESKDSRSNEEFAVKNIKVEKKASAGSHEERGRMPVNRDAEMNPLEDAKEKVFKELIKMRDFSEEVKEMEGVDGRPIDTVVSIGIGGSDLGPRLVTEALSCYKTGPAVHFISNIDGADTLRVLERVDVRTTLFIVVSKTFTTAETMENMALVKLLCRDQLQKLSAAGKLEGDCPDLVNQLYNKQFIAVTANGQEAAKHGIARVFEMWDFVGGRYSVWSAAGLSIALHIGFDNFMEFLHGASTADRDFHSLGLRSISARLAVNEIFYAENGYNNRCIVPYDSFLGLLHKYLQQAEMESNGKAGTKQMIIWGGTGTDTQHSFFQLLHQGEQNILMEFLIPVSPVALRNNGDNYSTDVREAISSHHEMLIANGLSQSRCLMTGRPSDETHKSVSGNKPSSTILYSRLSPATLGAILAVYEHKIFVQGIYYNINSFDQFGVQLGKDVALELLDKLKKNVSGTDPSTDFLISAINNKSQ